MNKEITIYELLGLIKDGKAPHKIEYDKMIYVWDDAYNGYLNIDNWDLFYKNADLAEKLNDTVKILVEILDEEDEFEDIEVCFDDDTIQDAYKVKETLNQLIRNQKKIIERLNKDEQQ